MSENISYANQLGVCPNVLPRVLSLNILIKMAAKKQSILDLILAGLDELV
jgi:hypothetical protein